LVHDEHAPIGKKLGQERNLDEIDGRTEQIWMKSKGNSRTMDEIKGGEMETK
jgi:hypothetical protein